jgi:hypothetical protein
VATTIPTDRMSGSGWDQARDVISANERGDRSNSVVVQPGGKLSVVSESEVSNSNRPLTVLPSDRMSALRGATQDDVDELSGLDPDNVEDWSVVAPSFLQGATGWRFDMDAPHQEGQFQFLAFRDPGRNNEWQVSPVYPNYIKEYGHGPHMLKTTVGGRLVPVICGPGGTTHKTLSSVRAAAAKWTLYTSCKIAKIDPGFSL